MKNVMILAQHPTHFGVISVVGSENVVFSVPLVLYDAF